MRSDLRYTDNPEAEVPRMFIDKEIGGKDEDGNPNIDGNEFAKELRFLSDTLGKKRIQVCINSIGGSVIEGMSIYNAIVDSKAMVDTYCYGLAASMAAVIFQAGRKKTMCDYSCLMFHSPYDPTNPDAKNASIEAMKLSICKMIAARTDKPEEEIIRMMRKETWIHAEEAKGNGFCDEISASDERNKQYMTGTFSVLDKWAFANKILNRIDQPKPKTTMENLVCKALELIPEANEEAKARAIQHLKDKHAESLTTVKNSLAEMTNKHDAKVKEYEALKAENDTLKAKVATAEKAAADAKEAEVKNSAKTAIAEAVKVGKLKNDSAIITKWEEKFIKDPETVKDLLDSMPGNMKSPSFKPEVTASKGVATSADKLVNEAQEAARKMGFKIGSAKYYNYLKNLQIKEKHKNQ